MATNLLISSLHQRTFSATNFFHTSGSKKSFHVSSFYFHGKWKPLNLRTTLGVNNRFVPIFPPPITKSPFCTKTEGKAADSKPKLKGDGEKKGVRGSVVPPGTPAIPNWTIISNILKYLWPTGERDIKWRVLFASSLLVASKLLTVGVPVLFKMAVDILTVAPANPSFWTLAPATIILGYGATRAGSALFNELKSAVFAKVSQSAIRKVSVKTFFHLQNLDLSFHLGRQTGALARAIERGSKGINWILTAMAFNVIPTIFEIALVCGILGYKFGPSYALVTAGTMAAYVAYTFGITSWRTKFRIEMNARENEAAQRSMDSLINYETVKYFNNEKIETERYNSVIERHDEAAIKSASSLSVLNVGQNFIFSAAITAAMIMASNGVQSGTMTVGDLVMINGLLFQLSLPLNFLGTIYREIKQALVDMETMFQLQTLESSTKELPDAKPLTIEKGKIEFKNVLFGYNADKPILKHVSVTFPPGAKVGIVGTSGAGKSTLLRLLYRFYDPKEGSIKIDDQDIKHLTLESLRKAIGVIPQDTVLFNDTIYYNIAYGNTNATEAEVHEAARRAHIHDTIMGMPEGYHTVVGERGLKLSGGEKQRVAIARAILKDPKILFCDEATSSVDTTTERYIQESLKELFKGRTSIYIAHRLSTIVDADKIIVLGPQGVVEEGTHAQLLGKNGVYHKMWNQQKLHGVEGQTPVTVPA